MAQLGEGGTESCWGWGRAAQQGEWRGNKQGQSADAWQSKASALGFPLSGQQWGFRQRNRTRALPPLGLHKLASRGPWRRVQEHMIWKPRATAVELVSTCDCFPRRVLGGDSTEVRGGHYSEGKTNSTPSSRAVPS